MKNSIIFSLLFTSLTIFGQAPTEPTPPKPGEQPLDGPQTENKIPITKQTPEQALEQKNVSISQLAALAPGGLNPGRNPQASPESNFINRFQDIPVNLYTGTPIINFPIYTLSEPGGASVPIGLSFNSSGMKAHDVASWVGMNWTFYAGGQITRIVRGIPDEGRYTIDGSYNITARKGFFQHGLKADNDNENDSQADLYFLNINDQSYKFTFDVNRKAHFFPEADIDVSVNWNARDNTTAGYFTNWVITMPDGTKYFFDGTATESSYEMEANTAKTLLYPNFGNYIKAENIPSAYYLTKIRMPFGHETNFEYHKSYYSYFKLAEQSTTTFNCTFSNINKAINRVYIESDVLFKISNNNITVELNKGGWSYEPRNIILDDGSVYSLGNYWVLNNTYPARTDIDRSENLYNSSSARALHKISAYDMLRQAIFWNGI
jgi:hypothetical protein